MPGEGAGREAARGGQAFQPAVFVLRDLYGPTNDRLESLSHAAMTGLALRRRFDHAPQISNFYGA